MLGLSVMLILFVWYWVCRFIAHVVIHRFEVRERAKTRVVWMIFALPFLDELIGTAVYGVGCLTVDKTVKYQNVIEDDGQLFTETGEWKLDTPEYRNRASSAAVLTTILEGYLVFDTDTRSFGFPIVPVTQLNEKVFDRSSRRLLVSWQSYTHRGGWIRRWVQSGSNHCSPKASLIGRSVMYRKLFVYSANRGSRPE